MRESEGRRVGSEYVEEGIGDVEHVEQTVVLVFFFFKQKTAYEIYQCDWSSDVCSSDLPYSTTTSSTVLPCSAAGLPAPISNGKPVSGGESRVD